MQLEVKSAVAPQQKHASLVLQPIQKQGLLFVLSAPSGTGKDTVIKALKEEQNMNFHVVSSVTTRAPRPGESEGNPYHFITQETFEQIVADNLLLEYSKVHGNWYGQPIQQLKDNLPAGRDVMLKIDVQGAAIVRKKVPEAIFIFLVPGSVEELVYRLVTRQTETEDERQRRLMDAQLELAQQEYYDYVVENRQGQLHEAVARLQAIMIAEHCKVHPRKVDL